MGALRPKKSLGQHFLRDENIARKIAAAIDPRPGDCLLEIGPGEGALTKYLVGATSSLIVVDIDDRVAARLQESFGTRGVMVQTQDFLETDLSALSRAFGGRIRVAGNIPYNITSPILFHVLDQRDAVRDLTIMMQREVARRLVARPGTKDYGILSVFCRLYADVELLFDVTPNAFFPKPKVMSSVVRLTMLEKTRCVLVDEPFFRSMVRGVFGKRRKTLRNGLRYFLNETTAGINTAIDLGRRPETLSLDELARLSNDLCHGRAPVAEG